MAAAVLRQLNKPAMTTYKGKFGDNDSEDSEEVDDEVRQVVVGIVRAEEEEYDGDREEELLGGGILGAIVNLLPHVEVIEGSAIEFEWNTSDIVEHDV